MNSSWPSLPTSETRLTILYLTGRPERVAGDMEQALGPVLSKPCTAERLHHEIEHARCNQGAASAI